MVVYQDYAFDPVDKMNSIDVRYLLYKAGAIADPGYTGDWASFWSSQLPHVVTADDAAAVLDDIVSSMGNGVMVTRNVGLIYSSSAHDITSKHSFSYDPAGGNGTWTLTLYRSLEGGQDDVNLARLLAGQLYNLGIAVHDVGLGDNSHHVSLPLTIGLGSGYVAAKRVSDVRKVDWAQVPSSNTDVYQPGNVSIDFLLDQGRHVGAFALDTLTCSDALCHGSVAGVDAVASAHVPARATAPLTLSMQAVVSAAPKSTSISVKGPAIIKYAATAFLSGTLRDSSNALLPSASVVLESSLTGTSGWRTVKTIPTGSGSFSASVSPRRATYYRLRYNGDLANSPSVSQAIRVKPKVSLTTPKAPRR
jgi:hypothetical protein